MKKKNILQERYSAPFFIVRTPLYSYTNAEDIINVYRLGDSAIEAFIREKSADPLVLESIYIASSVLHDQLLRFLSGEKIKPASIKRLFLSFYNYYIRMSTRATPFGTFAGCTLGNFDQHTSIARMPRRDIIRHIRLDMDLSNQIASTVLKDQNIYKNLRYFINSSIYQVGRKYRYTEYRLAPNGSRTHHIVSVDKTTVLTQIIKFAKEPKEYDLLIGLLVKMGYDYAECHSYIYELIGNQVLVSELEANVTGLEYSKRLVRVLSEKGWIHNPIVNELRNLEERFDQVNTTPHKVGFYQKIIQSIKSTDIQFLDNHAFQIDAYFPCSKCQIDSNVQSEVLEGIEALRSLTPIDTTKYKITKFKNAFLERYDKRIVPLSEALDTEIGIGYKSAESINDHYLVEKGYDYTSSFDLKLRKYHEWLKKESAAIEITDADIKSLPVNPLPLADSFSATVTILAGAGNGESQKLYIRSVSGPSGANLIGRFADLEPMIAEKLRSICKQEESLSSNKIFAEVVHLPQSRIGNVLARPHLREYEIPYLGTSTLPLKNQIHISDLYLMVRNNRLILFSKRFKKEVVARLSTAHNFRNGLPVYNFLCDLQFQDLQSGVYWDWGFLSHQVHLPRVTYKNLILSPETWFLNITHILEISNESNPDLMATQFRILKDRFKIPNQIVMVESDNLMLLDISSFFGISYLIKTLKRNKTLKVVENINCQNSPFVTDDEGMIYSNEVVMPFVKTAENDGLTQDIKYNVLENNSIKRKFAPGSEWLFFKIYLSQESSNGVLIRYILPPIHRLMKSGIIKGWFFMRYGDPKHHLRLRLHLSATSNLGKALQEIYSSLQSQIEIGVVWNFQLDTYHREIERYGYDTMLLSEVFFYYDSEFVCKLLKACPLVDYKLGMLMSVVVVDTIFKSFELSLDKRIAVCDNSVISFSNRLNIKNRPQIRDFSSDFYRDHRDIVYALFFDGEHLDPRKSPEELKILKKVSLRYAQKLNKLNKNLRAENSVSDDKIVNLLYSYIHMFVNRFFSTFNQDTEFLIYDFLLRSYKSRKARVKE